MDFPIQRKTGNEIRKTGVDGVRGIDNITRNQSLGVIWEKRRGTGRVLYCSLDLEAAKDLPEARALRRSLLDYLRQPRR